MSKKSSAKSKKLKIYTGKVIEEDEYTTIRVDVECSQCNHVTYIEYPDDENYYKIIRNEKCEGCGVMLKFSTGSENNL